MSAAPFARRMIAVPGGEIAGIEFGDPAQPLDVIFSIGNGFDALSYREGLAPLADRMRILAVDQRGHGLTRLPVHPEGRTSWWDLAPDLIALVDALSLDQPVILAGHSMGSVISLMATETLGERVKAVVAFDPVLADGPRAPEDFPPDLQGLIRGALRRRQAYPSREDVLASYRGRGAFAKWTEQALVDYVTDGFREVADGVQLACPVEWEAANYAAQGHDGRALLLAARRPVLVLKAGIDSACLVDADDPAVKANANLTIEVVEGATHCLPMERPDVVQAALLRAADLNGPRTA